MNVLVQFRNPVGALPLAVGVAVTTAVVVGALRYHIAPSPFTTSTALQAVGIGAVVGLGTYVLRQMPPPMPA